ncbi:MAG: hypothetical protein LBQ13_03925 [Endomicrobium sp.]|nr:hypothetical protein [Endomicrobium sp.]
MAIDIFLVISLILVARLGWSAGLVRIFFTVLSGFMAIFVATKYSHQEVMNFCFIFAITAILIIMLGSFTLKLIGFFYLKTLDRIGGVVLSMSVWLLVSINVVIPTVIHDIVCVSNKPTSVVYVAVSKIIQRNIPMFQNYILQFIENKIVLRQK